MRGRERLQPGCDRATDDVRDVLGERALSPAREDAVVGEDEIAGDAEDRRLADRVDEITRRVEHRVRLGREHDQVGPAHDLLVATALDAELDRALLAPLRVAGADVDFFAELLEALGERAAEGSGAADDRDLHTGTARTASARRRRAGASLISVRVTIVGIPASSPASASSTTSASIRPL